jgi:hypothetical protein
VSDAGDIEPIGLPDGEHPRGRELDFLGPGSDEDLQELLRRDLREAQAKSGNLTPKERARLALLIEFCVEDD